MLSLRNNYNNVLIYMNCYMFRFSLTHYQGVYSCIKQLSDLFIISSMCNCRKFINVWFIVPDMCKYPYMSDHICIQIWWHPYYTSIILTTFFTCNCNGQYFIIFKFSNFLQFLVQISVSINYTLMNFQKLHILELKIMSHDYSIQLYTPWWWTSKDRNM
jgi:hypothetical protein